jgi:hypothetical protein
MTLVVLRNGHEIQKRATTVEVAQDIARRLNLELISFHTKLENEANRGRRRPSSHKARVAGRSSVV